MVTVNLRSFHSTVSLNLERKESWLDTSLKYIFDGHFTFAVMLDNSSSENLEYTRSYFVGTNLETGGTLQGFY